MRLLQEAAGLEHLLMVQYLYAAFSIKEEYVGVRGSMGAQYYVDNVHTDLFGVAIEEMQHLDMVNTFLVNLGAAPNLIAQEFPFVCDIYPFALELKTNFIIYDCHLPVLLKLTIAHLASTPKCPHTPEEIE